MEIAWMLLRIFMSMAALVAWLWHWWHEDYPKATFYGVVFLMMTQPLGVQ